MFPADEPALSRSEWIVLSLICEKPAHGNAVFHVVGSDGDLGQIWRVAKAEVYRSLNRLSDLGLICPAGQEFSPHGPARSLFTATEAGQVAAVSWQQRPVEHTRDMRSELLIKLALLHRRDADPRELLVTQHEQLLPIASALKDRMATATGFDRALLLWRYETASAALRFLAAMTPTPP